VRWFVRKRDCCLSRLLREPALSLPAGRQVCYFLFAVEKKVKKQVGSTKKRKEDVGR
jgi:hypothetical protein